MDFYSKLLKLGVILEEKGKEDLSLRLSRVVREINAAPAKSEGIEISNWGDFLSWWGNNRGQNLKFIFIDTFGENSDEAKKVSELLAEADTHEANLHSFYMFLRNKAKKQKSLLKQQQGGAKLETGEEELELKPEENAEPEPEVEDLEGLEEIPEEEEDEELEEVPEEKE